MIRAWHRGTAAVTAGCLGFAQIGCMTVRRVEAPAEFIAARQPARIWVLRDGDGEGEQLVYTPRVLGDTIFGWDEAGQPLAVPLRRVREVRARQLHTGRTVAFGLTALAVTIVLATAVLGHGPAPETEPPEDAVWPRR